MTDNMNYEELGKDCSYCKECGGVCCRHMGCHFSPEDFEEISFDYLKDRIENTGCISIDWWEQDPREDDGINELSKCYFLRMRNRKSGITISDHLMGLLSMIGVPSPDTDSVNDEPAPIVDASWGGRCVLHTDEGCSISYENRPKGARWLIAKSNPDKPCDDAYSKKQCAIDWIPYQDILIKLEEYFRDKGDIPVNEYK